jgi:hypothetical protein
MFLGQNGFCLEAKGREEGRRRGRWGNDQSLYAHRSKGNQKKYRAKPGACQAPWLTPVIPATQEAEIRRMEVRSQPGQIVCETLSQRNPTQERAGGVAQGVGPEFKPQNPKTKKPPLPKKQQSPLVQVGARLTYVRPQIKTKPPMRAPCPSPVSAAYTRRKGDQWAPALAGRDRCPLRDSLEHRPGSLWGECGLAGVGTLGAVAQWLPLQLERAAWPVGAGLEPGEGGDVFQGHRPWPLSQGRHVLYPVGHRCQERPVPGRGDQNCLQTLPTAPGVRSAPAETHCLCL